MKKTFRLRPWLRRTSSWSSLIIVSLFFIFTGAQAVFAAEAGGLDKTAEAAFGAGKVPTGKVQDIVGNVIGAGLTMVGVLFLVLMIYGGITWMLARGNEQQSKKALDTIMAAVIGLIIVLGSYAFTNFVFTSVKNKPKSGVQSCVNSSTVGSCGTVYCSGASTQSACALVDPACCEWR